MIFALGDVQLARVQVTQVGDLFEGEDIELADDESRLAVFVAFEQAVNDQLFTHVETLEREIAELRPVLRTVDGGEFALQDVQIFPVLKAISFRLAGGTRFPDSRITHGDSDDSPK
jgi:hypothetical protein